MEKIAVIMAGGAGQRFWPKSRKEKPKQFLSLTQDGLSLLQKTVERLAPIFDLEHILVVTQPCYKELVREQLPEINPNNIVLEGASKNTAPCIGLAAVVIKKRWDNAVMVVLPSDHLIEDEERFRTCVKEGIAIAEKEKILVTFGMVPSYPEVGYGYIHYDKKVPNKVIQFEEKPSLEEATWFLKTGEYLWNSGMFIWQVDVILDQIKLHLPSLYDVLKKIQLLLGEDKALEKLQVLYQGIDAQSIDYGIMEKTKDIYVIHGDFGWDDVGSWLALEKITAKDVNGNTCVGKALVRDSEQCIIEADSKLVVALGLKDYVVIDMPDVLMICHKSRLQQLKMLMVELEDYEEGRYL